MANNPPLPTQWLPTPKQMNVSKNTEIGWKEFKESFKDYSIATELDKKDPTVQAATLKTLIGPDCKRILINLNLKDDEIKDPTQILAALDGQFLKKTNVIFERYNFYQANQQQNENVEQFLDRIRHLAKTCGFKATEEDDMIRDRLILGSKDAQARARMFRQKEVANLNDAIQLLKISEVTSDQMKVMNKHDSLNYVKKRPAQKNTKPTSHMKCGSCGTQHERRNCPAYGKTCRKCQRLHHYAKMCKVRPDKKKPYKKKQSVHLLNEQSEHSEYSSDELYNIDEINHFNDAYVSTLYKQSKKDNSATFHTVEGPKKGYD